jgi:hypothetical protein
MTHDELLAKMKELSRTFAYEPNLNFESALRAVVELHTPVTVKEMNGNIRFKCEECTNWDMGITEQDLVEIAYPCPTIQAIEKKLA